MEKVDLDYMFILTLLLCKKWDIKSSMHFSFFWIFQALLLITSSYHYHSGLPVNIHEAAHWNNRHKTGNSVYPVKLTSPRSYLHVPQVLIIHEVAERERESEWLNADEFFHDT